MASTRAPYWDKVTLDQLKKAKAFCGYPFFTSGDYNLNLFGIRTNEHEANTFNDVIGVAYKENGEWVFKKWEATTDPGIYYRLHPMDKRGAAVIVPSHYVGMYHIGMHKGQYKALRQQRVTRYFRKNDGTAIVHWPTKIYEEIGYTNIHRSNPKTESTQVDKWSCGCQVFKAVRDFNELMAIAQKSQERWGESISYTLFNEDSFFCRKKEDYEIVYKGKYVGG